MNASLPNDQQFIKYFEKHCKYPRLKGLQPNTSEAYIRVIRRIGNHFDTQIHTVHDGKGQKERTLPLP